MASIKMQIGRRTETGKNFVDKMRVNNIIPGVVYSRGGETVHISIDNAEFARVYRIAGASSLLELNLDGEMIPAIIKEIQRHPFKNQVLHVDFQKLNMDEKIKITIPVILINRDSIKLQPSVLMQQIDQIEIECLPGDIPHGAQIDVQDMDFVTPMYVKDLDIANNENIEILRDLDELVCALSEPIIIEDDEDLDEDLLELDEDGEAIETESDDEETESEE